MRHTRRILVGGNSKGKNTWETLEQMEGIILIGTEETGYILAEMEKTGY
jgi:hypothetical protein